MNFLDSYIVQSLHDEVLKVSGGLSGNRPDLSVDAITNRVEVAHLYGGIESVSQVAAKYAFAIIQGHVFLDGNKRTGTIAMLTFLKINNKKLDCSQDDLAKIVIKIAENKVRFDSFVSWLDRRVKKV